MSEPKRNPNWTEAELILALDTYFSIVGPDEKISSNSPGIIRTSEILNALDIHPYKKRNNKFRDPAGVKRRFGYFQKLDAGEDIEGRDAYKRVWDRYCNNITELHDDAKDISKGIYIAAIEISSDSNNTIDRDISHIKSDVTLTETEKRILISARRGQGKFRKDLLSYWGACALSGCTEQTLLKASHIKPWSKSTNREL